MSDPQASSNQPPGSPKLNVAIGFYAAFWAFCTYFCMYAFRKPFAAASYEGDPLQLGAIGSEIDLKTAFVVSQVLGYAISKYAGVKLCSEATRRARPWMLGGLIVAAQAALVLFGAIPEDRPLLKAVAIFLNGLPLGMVWGLVVQYLEGRRTSDLLLAVLSCSYIVSSGVVKDVGRALLAGADFPIALLPGFAIPNPLAAVPEYWMPAVTGGLFMAPFLLSVTMLNRIPEPDAADVEARVSRAPMSGADRSRFLQRYFAAIVLVLAVYTVLTPVRDYRDNYMVDLYEQLNYDYESNSSIVSRTEFLVALGTLGTLGLLFLIRDKRLGLLGAYGVMIAGTLLLGSATLLLDNKVIDGFWWMTLIGLGAYLTYVPVGTVLFDRLIAASGMAGTAVFGIYLADALGYTGSVSMQLGKDLLLSGVSRLDFLRMAAYLLSVLGTVGLMSSCLLVVRSTPRPAR